MSVRISCSVCSLDWLCLSLAVVNKAAVDVGCNFFFKILLSVISVNACEVILYCAFDLHFPNG